MHFIEPSPKNIITARLKQNGFLIKPIHPRFITSIERRRKPPKLPSNQTINTLFEMLAPWWTYVDQEPYIPLLLLASVLEPKEDKWKDDDGYHKGVFMVAQMDKAKKYSGIKLKSMTTKQKRPFVEGDFARHLIGGIVAANESQHLNVSKISYRLRPDVQRDEIMEIYKLKSLK